MTRDPRAGPKPPLPGQQRTPPGTVAAMQPAPDHGERSYRGSGKLRDRVALITGGIGRAIAIAFAREGADVMIAYLEEHEDARETAKCINAWDQTFSDDSSYMSGSLVPVTGGRPML